MEECIICFHETPPNHFVVFQCTHKVCVYCYPRLRVPLCPVCSRRIVIPAQPSVPSVPSVQYRLWYGCTIIGVLVTGLVLNYRNVIF